MLDCKVDPQVGQILSLSEARDRNNSLAPLAP